MRKIGRKKGVKFTDKKRSRKGAGSLILSGLTIICMIVSVRQAYISDGQGGKMLGGAGVSALIVEIAAFVLAVQAMREEDVFRGIPKSAMGISVVLLLGWIVIYGIGIVL